MVRSGACHRKEILVYTAFFAVCRRLGCNRIVDGLIAVSAIGVLVVLRRSAGNLRVDLVDAVAFFYLGTLVFHVRAVLIRQPAWVRHIAIILTAGEIGVAGTLTLTGQVRDIWGALLLAPSVVLCFELVTAEFLGFLSGLFQTLGNLTYASYMLHFPVELPPCSDWVIGFQRHCRP